MPMPDRRRSILTQPLVLLALAAGITVAVAWLASLGLAQKSNSPLIAGGKVDDDTIWFVQEIRRHGHRRLIILHADGAQGTPVFSDSSGVEGLPAWFTLDPTRVDEVDRLISAFEDGAGWPLPAMRCRWKEVNPSTSPNPAGPYATADGWMLRPMAGPPPYSPAAARALPLVPIPLGFAVNTTLAFAILALLWFLPRAIRRRRRLKAGCCPECGYLLAPGRSTSCPECGSAPPRAWTPDDGRTAPSG